MRDLIEGPELYRGQKDQPEADYYYGTPVSTLRLVLGDEDTFNPSKLLPFNDFLFNLNHTHPVTFPTFLYHFRSTTVYE